MMKFKTKIGERELEVMAWLLEHKTKVRNSEFYKGIVLTLVVLAVCVYDIFFYDQATASQKWILFFMTVACITKTVLCKLGKTDYLAIAKQKNKKMIGKVFTCTFDEAGVEIDDGKRTESISYQDLEEWGEYKGCIYILFSKGAVIILDKAKQEEKEIESLKVNLEKIFSCD